MTVVACVGTATEIGKTWLGAAVLSRVRAAGVTVAARKPVQSFDSTETGPTDAEVLAAATGEHPEAVCPPHRWYPVPMAPPMAAAVLGREPFTVGDLVGELAWPTPPATVRWVETVGGVRSPVAFDGDSVDLCAAVAPDLVVLAADAGLGTINAVRLSAAALPAAVPLVVFLNRWNGDELQQLNHAWLADRDGLDVVVAVDDLVDRVIALSNSRQTTGP